MSANPFFIESFRGYGPRLNQDFAAYVGPGNLAENAAALNPMSLQGLLAEYLSASFSNQSNIALINGLGGSGGTALLLNPNVNNPSFSLRHSMPDNYARIRCGFSHMTNLGGNGGVTFLDAGTAQCTIYIDSAGRVNVFRGASTIYQSGALILQNVRHYFVVDLTIHATTGTLDLWMDGTLLQSLTGLDTNSNANNFVNQWEFFAATAGNKHAFGDFFIQDNTDGAATITGDRIVDGLLVTADSAVQFSPTVGLVGDFHAQQTATTNAPGANQLVLVPVTPNVNATINAVNIMPRATSASAKFRGVIYADSSGSPDSLLSSGSEVTGCTSGTALALALTTPQALTAGTQYWIGYITDTSVAIQVSSPYQSIGQRKANTYTSGAPNPAGAMTTGQSTWAIWGTSSGMTVNYDQVNRLPPAMIASAPIAYNQSGTVGHVDSYVVENLSVTPTAIDLVQVKVLGMRTDAGARTINIRAKSGSTSGNGDNAGITPPTSLQWLSSRFANNPATSAPWTPAEVNGMLAEYHIAS